LYLSRSPSRRTVGRVHYRRQVSSTHTAVGVDPQQLAAWRIRIPMHQLPKCPDTGQQKNRNMLIFMISI
uniref:Uncharacterized protein n=1 Tax=Gongylonema pulchrum TaxID=637853 RepID=A0A183ET91_9BILA